MNNAIAEKYRNNDFEAKEVLVGERASLLVIGTGGQRLEDFVIEEFGEIISNLAAKSGEIELTFNKGRDAQFSMSASNSLKLPLGKRSEDLLNDLDAVENVLKRKAPDSLGRLEQLQALQNKDPRRTSLDEALSSLLNERKLSSVALTFPWEHEESLDEVEVYRLSHGRKNEIIKELTIDTILDLIFDVPADQKLGALQNGSIQAFSDEDAKIPISKSIKMVKWIAADVVLADKRFFLQQGKWYEIEPCDHDYLDKRSTEILNAENSTSLPAWPTGESEGSYNTRAFQTKPGYILLDKKLSYTQLHPRGFELADLLTDDHVLIHIKRGHSSASVSHLFAQALVSTESLLRDGEAVQKLRQEVKSQRPSQPLPDDCRPTKVIIAIGLPNKLSTESLFTFSKVGLVRLVDRFKIYGVEMAVIHIPES